MSIPQLFVVALGVLAALGQAPSPDFAAREARTLEWEKRLAARQPPEKILDAIGVRPGMVIGEVGAGHGRFTLPLSGRVGAQGKVYANEIDAEDLAFLAERTRAHGISNVETVLGTPVDPRFPRKDLDMIVMVWTFHMMEKPVEMLKSMVPYLKPGAAIVMVEPNPAETEAEIVAATARTGRRPTDIHVCSRESVTRDARAAGLHVDVALESLLKEDHIYILRRDAFSGLSDTGAVTVLGRPFARAILPSEGRLLHDLLLRRGFRRVLDVGTGEGYSTLWFALAMKQTGGRVITVEVDPAVAARAQRSFQTAGLSGQIDLRVNDALQEIPRIDGEFDFVFLDTGRDGLNKKILDLVRDRTSPGGIIASHNYQALGKYHPDFLAAITADPALETTVLSPLTGGISLTARKPTIEVEDWERRINGRQPVQKVIEALGVKRGMVVGEIGAGTGRVTVWLAAAVGAEGRVYANDIDAAALEHLRKRCATAGLGNVTTVLGTVADPRLPAGSLDIAFMTNTYHHLAHPVELVRNLRPTLKEGGILAIVERDTGRISRVTTEGTTRAEFVRQMDEAGFEVLSVDTSMQEDNIYLARPKKS